MIIRCGNACVVSGIYNDVVGSVNGVSDECASSVCVSGVPMS